MADRIGYINILTNPSVTYDFFDSYETEIGMIV